MQAGISCFTWLSGGVYTTSDPEWWRVYSPFFLVGVHWAAVQGTSAIPPGLRGKCKRRSHQGPQLVTLNIPPPPKNVLDGIPPPPEGAQG